MNHPLQFTGGIPFVKGNVEVCHQYQTRNKWCNARSGNKQVFHLLHRKETIEKITLNQKRQNYDERKNPDKFKQCDDGLEPEIGN